MRISTILAILSTITFTQGFSPAFNGRSTSTSLSAVNGEQSRSNFLKTLTGGAAAAAFSTLASPMIVNADEGSTVKLPSGTVYEVLKTGDGPQPTIGELAAIRFRAEVKQTGNKIDDIFDTPEPYYTRVGSGGLLKGVEEVLPKMRVGDRYFITVPTNMAFGPKGRPSSAGKPRIPGDAIITFEVEMVGLPGRETELIDLIGDE
jgi:peptidylprolyl isomerase